MKPRLDVHSIDWWFWALTLAALIAGLAGWPQGFNIVIGISLIQVVYFTIGTGPTSFPSQVRIVYAAFTILGLYDPTLILYYALLVGTFMVTVFNRCIIARVLILMPWNKGVKLSP